MHAKGSSLQTTPQVEVPTYFQHRRNHNNHPRPATKGCRANCRTRPNQRSQPAQPNHTNAPAINKAEIQAVDKCPSDEGSSTFNDPGASLQFFRIRSEARMSGRCFGPWGQVSRGRLLHPCPELSSVALCAERVRRMGRKGPRFD